MSVLVVIAGGLGVFVGVVALGSWALTKVAQRGQRDIEKAAPR